MATYRKRTLSDGSVRHQYIVRRKGAPVRVFTGETKTKAKKAARAHEAEIDAGKVRADRATVTDALGLYRASAAYRGLADEDKRRRHLEWWEERLGGLPLAQPEAVHEAVQAGILALETSGGLSGQPASPATVNRYVAALSKALEVARKSSPAMHRALLYNPARAVLRPSEAGRGRVRVFTDDEYKALLAACQASSDPRLEPLFLLACSSAARISELLALRRPDVNLVAGDAVVWNSKNGQSRVLRFRGPAVEALRAYVAATPEPITRHVFVGPRGPTEPRSAWEGAMRAAGVEDAGWHTCRHTSLTWLAMQGASEHELMDHAGHKTSAMASRYVHLAAVHRSEVAPELVARRFQAA